MCLKRFRCKTKEHVIEKLRSQKVGLEHRRISVLKLGGGDFGRNQISAENLRDLRVKKGFTPCSATPHKRKLGNEKLGGANGLPPGIFYGVTGAELFF